MLLNGEAIQFKESIKPTQPLIDYILVNHIVQTIMESKHNINTNSKMFNLKKN
jgi:hypothetical protein